MTTYGSRFANKEGKVQADEESSSDESELGDEQIQVLKQAKGDNFRLVKGEKDLAYKVIRSE